MLTTPTLDLNDLADGGGQALARSPTYPESQQALDRLAAASSPVQHGEIIGRDLRLVERLTGRMTPARASATRALTGAWFGLLIALLISLLTFGPAWLGLLLGGLLIGALSGAMLGYLAHRIGSGQHDHASPQVGEREPHRRLRRLFSEGG
jgi:hypothetical protein